MIIKYRVEEYLKMPYYQGSTLRGVIGHGLRRVSCDKLAQDCEKCPENKKCPYAKAFYHIEKASVGLLSGINTPPNPYVIYPLDKKSVYQPGERLAFSLTLFGSGTGYVHHYIMAMDMVKRLRIGSNKGRVSLDSIANRNSQLIAGEGIIRPEAIISNEFVPSKCHAKRVKLCIDTPIRLMEEGKPAVNVTFLLLMKNIIRRVTLLYSYYMEKPLETDIETLLEKAKDIRVLDMNIQWEKRQRYSSRQHKKISIGGFKGSIVFEGMLDEFMPWLELGSIVHVGKGCTLGLGHYSICAIQGDDEV